MCRALCALRPGTCTHSDSRSLRLSLCPSVCPSSYLSIYQSISSYQSICLSIFLYGDRTEAAYIKEETNRYTSEAKASFKSMMRMQNIRERCLAKPYLGLCLG